MADANPDNENSWDNLIEDIESEAREVQRELSEIDTLLEQSQVEVEKLTQRNATITAHLQQVQTQLEEVPPADIRVAYDAALEAQQRLAVMRGQLEKLHSDKEHMQRLQGALQKVQASAQNGSPGEGEAQSAIASVEVMTQAQESERQRLSRQTHDGPAQALSTSILQTEIALRLFDVDSNQAREELTKLKGTASETFQKVRDFIFDLRPMMLDDLGLIPTIKRYAENYSEKSGISAPVSLTGTERRLESHLEVILFRAVQELLNAHSLHEQASEIKVQIDIGDKGVRLTMEDNGRGFEPSALPEEAELGIKAIRERLEMLGGTFEIDSAVGQGARFALQIPTEAGPALG